MEASKGCNAMHTEPRATEAGTEADQDRQSKHGIARTKQEGTTRKAQRKMIRVKAKRSQKKTRSREQAGHHDT
jgi:hypothetical protein